MASQPKFEPAVMSITEFGRWAGVGRTTTYAEIKTGALRAVKFGRRTLILTEDAKAWLQAKPFINSAAPQEGPKQ